MSISDAYGLRLSLGQAVSMVVVLGLFHTHKSPLCLELGSDDSSSDDAVFFLATFSATA